MELLLVSHRGIATGMKSAVSMVMGALADQITTMELTEDEGIEQFAARLEEYICSCLLYTSVLLYRPTTAVRKKALFELLHNAEEATEKSAYILADDMELTVEDYLEIEKNLKYKKGRAGVLALLRKQKPEAVRGSMKRLLETDSEECRMGALDLALWVKKEHPETFAAVRDLLRTVSEPTGREQVLLEELLGTRSCLLYTSSCSI